MRITPEDQAIIKKKFPKFSKIQACMCNNPDYGVSLSPKAQKWLNQQKSAVKSNAKSNVVSARVKDRDMDILKELAREQGLTVGELIKTLIEERIHETTLCKGMSVEDIDVPD